MNQELYQDIPSSDEEEDPPQGVPTLRRQNPVCPFCLKRNINLQSHVPKCYIKACKREGTYPFCTCPDHKGIATHSIACREGNQIKRKLDDISFDSENTQSTLSSPSFSIQNEDEGDFPVTRTPIDNSAIYESTNKDDTQFELGKSRVCVGRIME